jgi:hypothetical protein
MMGQLLWFWLAMGSPMPQLAVLPLQSILLNQSPES